MLDKFPNYALILALAVLSACNAVEAPSRAQYIPGTTTVTAGDRVTVKQGDTVYGLARRYNVPMRDLIAVNNLQSPFQLKAGTSIVLPATQEGISSTSGKLVVAKPTIISGGTEKEGEKTPVYLSEDGKAGDVTYSQKAPLSAMDILKPKMTAMDILNPKTVEKPPEKPTGSQVIQAEIPPPPKPKDVLSGGKKKKEEKNALMKELALPPIGYDQKKRQFKEAKIEVKPGETKIAVEPGKTKDEIETAAIDAPQQEVKEETREEEVRKEIKKETDDEAAKETKARVEKVKPRKKVPGESEDARKARFGWPVQGPVLSTYGPKTNGLRNDGINIGAPRGTPVIASDSGTVAYAGSDIPGFGNVVLVRHASGLMTTYAHLDRMFVQRDSIVARGDALGSVGTSGGLDTPQLHFEIRSGQDALDPGKYLYAR